MPTTLRMAVWKGYDDPEAAAPFLERHGVRVDPVYVDDDETIRELLAAERGRVVLAVPDNRYVPVLARAGLIAPIDEARVPNAARAFPAFRRLARPAPDGAWSVPYVWGGHPMAYNASHLAAPPASWLDVLDPAYRGKVVMLDAARNQITLWAGILGHADPVRLTPAELDRVIDFLVDVRRRTEAFMVPWAEIPDALASGRAWIATAGWEAVSHYAREQGADVRVALPREGAPAWMDCWAVAADAANGETAHAWIDWMVGAKAQAIVARNLPCGTVNRDAVDALEADVRARFPHERIEELFANPATSDLPPVDPEDGITSLDDWQRGWERVRAAI
jgi:putative spermidine/putrescine transport system substrate-binding protein